MANHLERVRVLNNQMRAALNLPIVMESDLRDLLTGHLRDLTTARDSFAKVLANHKGDLPAALFDELEKRLENIEGEIGSIACTECYGADMQPYGLAEHAIDQFTTVCDDCYDRLNAKREPFDGDCSRGF